MYAQLNEDPQAQEQGQHHFANAIITSIRAACDFVGLYFSNEQLRMLSLSIGQDNANDAQLNKYLTARLIFLSNNFQFFDNDWMQLLDYKQ